MREPYHLKGLNTKVLLSNYVTSALRAAGYRQKRVDQYDEAIRNLNTEETIAFSQKVIDNINEGLGL